MKDSFAPYAPPSAVLSVIQFYRNRDVPASVTLTNLQQIGVTEGLAPRVLAALKFLGLVREDGTTTDEFRAIRYASDDDYQQVLSAILEAAYKGVLDHIDLATAGDRELNNAFIPYSPGGQRSRMITLFQALAKEAGWPLAVEPKSSSPRAATIRSAPRPKTATRRSAGGRAESKATTSTGVPVDQNLGQGLRLSVTASDLDALSEQDFDTVWSALGLLQKARRQALKASQDMADAAAARRAAEEEVEPEGQ